MDFSFNRIICRVDYDYAGSLAGGAGRMSEFNVWAYVARMGVSVKGPGNSRSLAEGDKVAGMNTPTFLTLEDIEEFLHVDYEEFSCQAPGCKESFSQLHECETHYNAVHRHSCSVCRKSLPSPHLLELHLQESHDSFFAVLSEKKPSYQCFLPTCSNLSWSPAERHQHAVETHQFPPDFRFDDVKKRRVNGNNNSQKNKSKPKNKKETNGGSSAENDTRLRRPMSLAKLGEHFKSSDDMEVDLNQSKLASKRLSLHCWAGTTPDVSKLAEETPLTSPSSHNQTSRVTASSTGKKSRIPVRSNSCRIPRNLSFGAGIPKTFLRRPKAKHWHQAGIEVDMETETNIEETRMTDLRDSLPLIS